MYTKKSYLALKYKEMLTHTTAKKKLDHDVLSRKKLIQKNTYMFHLCFVTRVMKLTETEG